MNLKSCVAALGLCMLPLCSQAGIVYEWRPLNGETPRGISLALEFDERTVHRGAFSFTFNDDYYFTAQHDGTGLLGLRYAFPGADEAMTYSHDNGFGSGFGTLEMELSFDPDGFLSGYIYANDNRHHFQMNSTGRTFTVLDANSDEGMPWAECGWTVGIDCAGASGQIQRTNDIPEPGSLALLGIGLLAAARARRKPAP